MAYKSESHNIYSGIQIFPCILNLDIKKLNKREIKTSMNIIFQILFYL